MKSHDIFVGDRFGRWTVVGEPVRKKFGTGRGANYPLLYPCRCDCGAEREVRAFKLLSNSRSCGCLKLEELAASVIHGHNRKGRRTRLYRVWDGMTQRCTNSKHDGYPLYGGRGISITPAWRDFSTFASWALANGFSPDLEIDRIDNDGNYEPGNCHWTTPAGNRRNTRQNHYLTAFGETKCLTDWALDLRCNVTPATIRHRMAVLSWTTEHAISAPRQGRKTAPRFAGWHLT